MRFLAAATFLGAAGWVGLQNSHGEGEIWLFPFLASVAGPSPAEQGRATVLLLLAVGLLFLARDLRWYLRRRAEG